MKSRSIKSKLLKAPLVAVEVEGKSYYGRICPAEFEEDMLTFYSDRLNFKINTLDLEKPPTLSKVMRVADVTGKEYKLRLYTPLFF